MYTRSQRSGKFRLAIGALAVLWLFFAVCGLGGASADRTAPVGESGLFNGSQKFVAPEEPRGAHRSQRTEDRVQRRATALLRKAMSPPQEIPLPRDIPTYKESGGRIVFPKHGYEDMYFQGWNECLYVIGSTNAKIHGEIMTSCLTSFNNNWSAGGGLVAGFHDCQRRIIFLAKIYNLGLIRTLAKELHREIPDGVAWERKTPAGADRPRDRVRKDGSDHVGKEGEKASRKTPINADTD
jgi:hypothetical protein